MTPSLDPHSFLNSIHSDLAAVIRLAAQSPQPFRVVYGIRTLDQEREAVATGHSETLHSRHLPDSNYGNVAMAVDIACLDADGAIDWTVSDSSGGIYGVAAKQILHSAAALGIAVQWGGAAVGAWTDNVPSHFHDWGHFQLDPSRYP